MQRLVFKTLAFAGESNQWVKVLSSTASQIGANALNTPNVVKFNSQLAKE